MCNPSSASLIFTVASFSTILTLLYCSHDSPAKESHSSLLTRHVWPLPWEAFTTAPVLTHWIPDCPIVIETDASDYALAAILSSVTEDDQLHPVAFHSCSFSASKLNYDIHDKELFAIYEAFRIWCHYLEGSVASIDIITDHKNLEYFATTKLLNCCQVRWSEFLSQFNLIICFQSRKLGTKPDALTHRWDVYLKEGGSDYTTVNLQNLKPIFSQEQLATSLHATKLYATAVSGAYIIDINQLTEDIQLAYLHDSSLLHSYPDLPCLS